MIDSTRCRAASSGSQLGGESTIARFARSKREHPRTDADPLPRGRLMAANTIARSLLSALSIAVRLNVNQFAALIAIPAQRKSPDAPLIHGYPPVE